MLRRACGCRGSRHFFLHNVGLLGALEGANQALLLDGHFRLSSLNFVFRPTHSYIAWRVPNCAAPMIAHRTIEIASCGTFRRRGVAAEGRENSPTVKN